MKVAVIGTGNSGCAHACMLKKNGHFVTLIKSSNAVHNENFDIINKHGGITLLDTTQDNPIEEFFEIDVITTDISEGISGAECILVLTQSLQHLDLAKRVGHLLKPGQMVLIIPGNLGSLKFNKYLINKDVVLAEGESTSFDARIYSPGKVQLLFRNERNAISFLCKEHECYLSKADELFGSYKYLRTNVVETALHNPNLIVHTIGTIMSASRIELCKGEFWMYRESFSPSIWNLIEDLDMEKNHVIESFGGVGISYLDACKWRNQKDLSLNSREAFNRYAYSGAPKGPATLDTRYINEDVPMGLCLLENLGKLVNVNTPITSSLINIASSIRKTDFRSIAYTLSLEEFKEIGLL